ncbi:Metalloprotease family M20D [Phytophthora palmivora]|uniref:Metalloprotease family M20D n=1 Tax=Phytophthora palmivora TaxID=4796 RepID=A0A2P4XCH0_9STRA|nr:Metalloprotease family M20D [Phytophthora palmivora]
MERRGVGKRLTDGQRVEILKLFESGAAITEAEVARRYGVSRSAIWRLRRSGQRILERYQEADLQSRDERRRGGPKNGNSNAVVTPIVNMQTIQPQPKFRRNQLNNSRPMTWRLSPH